MAVYAPVLRFDTHFRHGCVDMGMVTKSTSLSKDTQGDRSNWQYLTAMLKLMTWQLGSCMHNNVQWCVSCTPVLLMYTSVSVIQRWPKKEGWADRWWQIGLLFSDTLTLITNTSTPAMYTIRRARGMVFYFIVSIIFVSQISYCFVWNVGDLLAVQFVIANLNGHTVHIWCYSETKSAKYVCDARTRWVNKMTSLPEMVLTSRRYWQHTLVV